MTQHLLLALLGFAFASVADLGHAEEAPGMRSTLTCERRPGKGRLVCELEVEAIAGRIAWADVVVVTVPSIAKALKSRVGFREASARSDARVRLPLALVATALGEGLLTVRARAVVCRTTGDQERCAPESAEVSGDVLVGPLRSAPSGS